MKNYDNKASFSFATALISSAFEDFRSQKNYESDRAYKLAYDEHIESIRNLAHSKIIELYSDCSNNFEAEKLKNLLLLQALRVPYNKLSKYKTR